MKNLIGFFFILFSTLFIFSVSVNGFMNFSYVGILGLPLIFFTNNNFFQKFLFIARSKFFLFSAVLYLAIVIFTFSYPGLRGTEDYSFSISYLHILVSLPACIATAILIRYYFGSISGDLIFIKSLLFLQSFVIVLMMFFPGVREIIFEFIRTEDQIQRMATYGGVRGLGLSGSIAFGFSIVLGLLFYINVYLTYSYNKQKFRAIDYFEFAFICFAMLAVGRASILGLLCALGAIFFLFITNTNLKNRGLSGFLIFIFAAVCFFYIVDSFFELSKILDLYVRYVFQMYYLFVQEGTIEISSLAKLNNMYFIPTDPATILFGDALYMDKDGGYYKSVDAGYMRFIFFFGVVFSSVMYILYLIFLILILNILKKGAVLRPSIFVSFLGIMVFVYHYKGDIVFINVSFHKMIFILAFYYILKNHDLHLRSLRFQTSPL